MEHDTPLIATIAVGLALAFVLGVLAQRFRLPPIAGYLVAGILVGRLRPALWPTRNWRWNWPRLASSC